MYSAGDWGVWNLSRHYNGPHSPNTVITKHALKIISNSILRDECTLLPNLAIKKRIAKHIQSRMCAAIQSVKDKHLTVSFCFALTYSKKSFASPSVHTTKAAILWRQTEGSQLPWSSRFTARSLQRKHENESRSKPLLLDFCHGLVVDAWGVAHV